MHEGAAREAAASEALEGSRGGQPSRVANAGAGCHCARAGGQVCSEIPPPWRCSNAMQAKPAPPCSKRSLAAGRAPTCAPAPKNLPSRTPFHSWEPSFMVYSAGMRMAYVEVSSSSSRCSTSDLWPAKGRDGRRRRRRRHGRSVLVGGRGGPAPHGPEGRRLCGATGPKRGAAEAELQPAHTESGLHTVCSSFSGSVQHLTCLMQGSTPSLARRVLHGPPSSARHRTLASRALASRSSAAQVGGGPHK